MAEDQERLAFVAQVATEYYDQAKTTAEIAAEHHIDEETVKQLLSEALRTGVVEVVIRSPWKNATELEAALVSAFQLKAARVLVRENQTYVTMQEGLGKLASQYLASIVRDKDVIGVSWGSALYHMIKSMPPMNLPSAEVVQLVGATGSENEPTDGPILAQLLANRLNCSCRHLHAPLVVEGEAGRNALFQERSIRETLARAEHANIALVGIGSTRPELYSLVRTGYLTLDQAEEIRAAGAVGDICGQHFNLNGEWLNLDINRRVITISLDTLSHINTVIGVAGGMEKVEPIFAALNKQYINVLVTDDTAARALLEMCQTGKSPAAQTKTADDRTAKARSSQVPLISLRGIWKVFDGVAVLRGVNLDLFPGEIHSLLGGNGSGKSTLMKVLSGIYTPDVGSIEIEGSPTVVHGPAHGHELGIHLVPQEPQIFSHLTVEENILLGSNLQASLTRQKIQELSEELGFQGDLTSPAGSLSIANQQLLEIIRGLLRNARVLILDEPTSTLTFREVDSLFSILGKLSNRGIGIFFISHRLNEILAISDRISVLRDGNLVLSSPNQKLNTRDLIHAMLPENTGNGNGDLTHEYLPTSPSETVLELKDLCGASFQHVDLKVRCGEVVGLAGVVGAGRTELARAILGVDTDCTGEVVIAGRSCSKRSPGQCAEYGLVYVPEDRHAHGIFLELPNLQTTSAAILPRLGRWLLSMTQERVIANQFVERLQIKMSGLDQIARTLSGGNQQKVVLAKCLAGDPKVVILDEPTRGVDAKARQDVYHLIHTLTEGGVGVLLISSDLEEVIQLSDRVLVMVHGMISEELSHAQCGIGRITASAFGIRE